MRPELLVAIDTLEKELAAIDQQALELRNTINTLCKSAGVPLRYTETMGNSQSGATISQIKSDTFYGKKMQTAAREFLEMRKRADLSAAKPREIFDALRSGGFEFETKDETTALISLRGMLRKNSATFHKLPNGEYGLRIWYPTAKQSRSDDEEENAGPIRRAVQKRQKRTAKSKRERTRNAAASEQPATTTSTAMSAPSGATLRPRDFVLSRLAAGNALQLPELVSLAEEVGYRPDGVKSIAKAFHNALLGLKSQKLIEKGTDGWRRISREAA
jgi:hypothetical protein